MPHLAGALVRCLAEQIPHTAVVCVIGRRRHEQVGLALRLLNAPAGDVEVTLLDLTADEAAPESSAGNARGGCSGLPA